MTKKIRKNPRFHCKHCGMSYNITENDIKEKLAYKKGETITETHVTLAAYNTSKRTICDDTYWQWIECDFCNERTDLKNITKTTCDNCDEKNDKKS